MTLQTSGQITINDIVGEFGGSGQHGLTEYYRGGAFVPDTGSNSSIPTSGEITLTDFYGGTNFIAEDNVISKSLGDTFTASVSTIWRTNGDHDQGGTNSVENGAWSNVEESGHGGDWEIRLDINSGPNPTSGPTLATYHLLSTEREWVWTLTGGPTEGRYRIRDATSLTVFVDITITITTDTL